MLAKLVTTALLLINLLFQSIVATQSEKQTHIAQICEQVPSVASVLHLTCEQGA